MPRLQPVYFDTFHTPLTEDVEELLARFQSTDSVRYEVFSAIWRDMGLSDVYLGLTSRLREMKRFTRIVLSTAVKYFLPPYSYQIRVGGLYLMFAFYHTQYAIPPIQIRVAVRDWDHIQKFVKESMTSGHYDVVYIYKKLVAEKAFHYTAMPHFLTFQKQRKPKKEQVCAEFLGRTTAIEDLMSSDLLEEISNTHNCYEKLKEDTAEVSSQDNMINRDIVASLKDCMSEFILWQERAYSKDNKDKNSGGEDEDDISAEAQGSSRAKLLSSIKQKSYSSSHTVSKSRRHRQTQVVESSSSGPEQVHETTLQKKRPQSLRVRTQRSLSVLPEESMAKAWLLSALEPIERTPPKRMNKGPPYD